MFRRSRRTEDSAIRPLVGACAVVAAVVVALTAWSWAIDGMSDAIRTASSIAMPVGLAWGLLSVACIWSLMAGRFMLALGLLLPLFALTMLGNQRIANRMIRSVEMPREKAADRHLSGDETEGLSSQAFRCVVVLGGGVGEPTPGFYELHRDGERIFTAAQFWHAGKTKAIITTGSSHTGVDPSESGRDLLVSVNVPEESIFKIEGYNTVDEMKHLSEFLEDPPGGFAADGPIGLITSAFHMPRAMRLAKRQGLDLEPLPVAFRQADPSAFRPYRWIPDVGSLRTATTAIHEWIGSAVGR